MNWYIFETLGRGNKIITIISADREVMPENDHFIYLDKILPWFLWILKSYKIEFQEAVRTSENAPEKVFEFLRSLFMILLKFSWIQVFGVLLPFLLTCIILRSILLIIKISDKVLSLICNLFLNVFIAIKEFFFED